VRLWPESVRIADRRGRLALHHALQKTGNVADRLALLHFLLAHFPRSLRHADCSDKSKIPLHYALHHRQTLGILRLLVEGWPEAVRETTRKGESCLHLAAQSGASSEATMLFALGGAERGQQRSDDAVPDRAGARPSGARR
jgi:Ankyrin repeats (3 copies)